MIFKDLAIIIVAAKFFGLIARKIHVPQVVGEIVAGLILGPSILAIVAQSDFLNMMAEIGVILLMFSAGLETDLKNLIKTGPVAFFVALVGVIVPLVSGTLLYMLFYGFSKIGTPEFYRAIFIGIILTATSVSITVKTLEEMGKLNTELGTTIVSAAIIDDVIGILVLTIVVGIGAGEGNSGILSVVLRSILFFVVLGISGIIIYKIFKLIDKRYEHSRRIPILGLALCMFLSYAAERFFGIADITGAYAAGIILCNIRDASYIDRKMSISSYMLFGPIFFAGIGLKTNIRGFSSEILFFSICFVLVGLISKVIGCGFVGKVTRHSLSDSAKIGVGMMTRGEVALIVSQKGLSVGLVDSVFFTPVILLIITSSILTPIALKLLYKKE